MGHFLDLAGSRWGGSLVLGALVLLVFARSIGNEFTLDSRRFLVEDPRVRDLDVGAIFTTDYWHYAPDPGMKMGQTDLYRPLTLLWLSVLRKLTPEAELEGGRSGRINAGNVLLHAAGVVLRFLLIRALLAGRPRAGAWALAGGVLLAVHPVATEAVCTQVGASETLAVALSAGSLLAFLRWQETGRRTACAAHAVLFLLALLSKENAVVVVVLAPLIAWLARRRTFRQAAFAAVPAAVVAAAWIGLRAAIFGGLGGVADPVFAGFPLSVRLATALAALGAYDLPALVWPANLLPLLSHQDLLPAAGFGDPRTLLGLAVLAALVGGAVAAWRRDRVVALGLLTFLLSFLPVSNLLVVIGAIGATRFLYFPLTGLALAFAAGMPALTGSRTPGVSWAARLVLVSAMVVPLAFTVREVPVWRDEVTLYTAAWERSPSAFSGLNLGVVLKDRAEKLDASGDRAQAQRCREQAIQCFEQGAKLPRPRIPGTDLVPEDVLDVEFKIAMNAGLANVMMVRNPAAAREFYRVGREVAATGLDQSARMPSTTVWNTHLSDVHVALADAAIFEATLTRDPAERERKLAEAQVDLARSRELWTPNWKAELAALKVFQVRGDAPGFLKAFEETYARARPGFATDKRALEVAKEFGGHLMRIGQQQRGLKVMLEAMCVGKDLVDGDQGYFELGSQALSSPDPETRTLGRQALEEFLRRSGPPLERQRQEAWRRLKALRP